MSVRIINWRNASQSEQKNVLQRPADSSDDVVRASVSDIVAQVRTDGDAAIRRMTHKHDGVTLEVSEVSGEEFRIAAASLTDAQSDAIDIAISNVRKFHDLQVPTNISVETMPGVLCERVSHPIDAVGLYVPAGSAPLPSTAIMLAVPAAIAACPTRVLCTPPGPDGRADAAVLVAAQRAGIETIFKIGGAQAIAAMAYGTESVPAVDKIFGPGNTWVTAAKTLVAADVHGAAIDMPAGPSEVLIIADATAQPAFVAADLLSQAEHGRDSQVLLLTPDRQLARAVTQQIAQQILQLPRKDVAAQALLGSAIIVVHDIAEAIEISNAYAPEHLLLQTADARTHAREVRNAGSVFVGAWSPESVGDYCSGTNHVLPTYGHAKSFSGLGVDQFMRQMTLQELSASGLNNIGNTVIELAMLEGLDAHAAAVRLRLAAMEAGT